MLTTFSGELKLMILIGRQCRGWDHDEWRCGVSVLTGVMCLRIGFQCRVLVKMVKLSVILSLL
jgi:hypothetical protein